MSLENEENYDAALGADFGHADVSQPRYVYDGRQYWLENAAGEWIPLNTEQLVRHLRSRGLESKARPGATLSEIEIELSKAEMDNRVKWAGALAGHWRGFKQIAGHNILVTQDPELVPLIEPQADAAALPQADAFGDSRGWPTLGRVIRNLLSCEAVGDEQLWVWLSYVRHTLDCLYGHFWDKAPALAIAGEVQCGKSLLMEITQQLFGKRMGKPYDWFIGRENFNADLLECVLLIIDDEVSDTNPKSRAILGDRLKNIVAAAGGIQRIRGMHKEGISLQPLWRIMLCVNDTPDKLMILPQMEDDNSDKIILLKAYRKPMPMPAETPADRRRFWGALMHELPRFAWWLMHEFSIPDRLRGRFGIAVFHHPAVMAGLNELSPEMQFWHYIEKTIFKGAYMDRVNPRTGEELGKWEWMGTATDLYSFLTDTSAETSSRRPVLNPLEAQSIPKPAWIGQRLSRISRIYPDCAEQQVTAAARYWHIKPPAHLLGDEKPDTDDGKSESSPF